MSVKRGALHLYTWELGSDEFYQAMNCPAWGFPPKLYGSGENFLWQSLPFSSVAASLGIKTLDSP